MCYVDSYYSLAGQISDLPCPHLRPSRWISEDAKEDASVELVYLPTWTSDVDSGGFFFLRMPDDSVEQDDSVLIAVRSLGEGSQRWFAVDSNQEIPARLKLLDTALQER